MRSQNSRRALASTPAVGVEEQQFRLVQHACGEREALLPAARQLPGELVAASLEAHALEDRPDRLPSIAHLVDARDEVEILEHREVLVKAEALRHVADLTTNFVRLADDVVAQAVAGARVRFEQPAQHADRRRLATAVGAEESADLALGDLQAEAFDDLQAAETLGEIGDVDDVGVHGTPASGFTVTGWPGLKRAASAGGGRASARKTNLLRVCSE